MCSICTSKDVWKGHNDTFLKMLKAFTENTFFWAWNERIGGKGTKEKEIKYTNPKTTTTKKTTEEKKSH